MGSVLQSSPTSKELKEFENEMMEIITKVEMKIRNSKYFIISADKIGNLYQVDPKEEVPN